MRIHASFNLLTVADNVINLHKAMVDTASGADIALGRAVNAANEALMRQEEFSKEVRRFQDQVMQDLEVSKVETQSFIGSLLKQVDGVLRTVTRRLFEKVNDIESEANKVNEVSSALTIPQLLPLTFVGSAIIHR